MLDLEGTTIDGYQLVRRLSKGGMADVYAASRAGTGNVEAAVKVFRPSYAQSASARAHFFAEAEKISQLIHPHILPLLSYGEGEGFLYSISPFIQTGTVGELQQRVGGRFSALQVLPILQQVCSALQVAHEQQIVHGNIKPGNIFVGATGRLLVGDFALLQNYDDSQQSLTRVGWGSAEYVAPEQSLGILHPVSDIYALGVLLFSLLTSSVPFSGQTPVEVLLKHVRQSVPSTRSFVPSISDAVDAVVMKALQKRADERYPSVTALCEAFETAVAIAPIASPIARTQPLIRAHATPLTAPLPQPAPSVSSLLPGRIQAPIIAPPSPVSLPNTPIPVTLLEGQKASAVVSREGTDEPADAAGTAPAPQTLEEDDLIPQLPFPPVAPLEEQVGHVNKVPLSPEPPEWSPIAVSVDADDSLQVPATATGYLRRKALVPLLEEPVAAIEEDLPIAPENVQEPETLNDRLRQWLPFIVVILLLLGLLAALCSAFFFPTAV